MSQKRRSTGDEPFFLVRSLASDAPTGSTVTEHFHDWHQLIYVASGLMRIDTEQGFWIAPPTWAVWVPTRAVHSIRFIVKSALSTIYVRPDVAGMFECRSLAVSPLLRELILRTVETEMLDERDPTERATATLMLAELDRAGPPAFTLRQPSSPTLVEAARLLADEASCYGDIASAARQVGVGARTLERRFRAETGLTPGQWRQQRKLLRGLEVIASGASVKAAAAEAGFASPSAYVAAFGKQFGTTPARFFAAR